MITFTRLGRSGRLGNQMWQLASTAGIAQTLGQTVALPHWDYAPYFRVPQEFFEGPIIRDDGRPTIQADQTELVNHIDPRARVYLQDFNLWKNIASQVRSWFQPSDLALDRIRQEKWLAELPRPILSVHVRRGDNAAQPNDSHPLRPWSYYEKSIEKFDGQFESILVFSDDIEFCRSAFRDYGIKYEVAYFVGGLPRKKEHEVGYRTDPFSDWIDLQVSARYGDLFIIGNSTYAWWSAFLSHPDTPVIYPWPWFGPALQYIDADLMMPKGWEKIDHGQVYT